MNSAYLPQSTGSSSIQLSCMPSLEFYDQRKLTLSAEERSAQVSTWIRTRLNIMTLS